LVNEDPQGKAIPGLATKWRQTPNFLEFTLRSGVTFHDGTPFNAAAVKANLERVKSGGFPPTASQLAAIKSIDVLSDTVVRLQLSDPAPYLLTNLQRFAGLMLSPAAFGKLGEMPVGTGPYRYNEKDSVKGSKYVFDLNDKYFDLNKEGPARVEVWYLPDYQAAYNAVLTGQIEASTILESNVNQARTANFQVLLPESFHLGLAIMDREGKMVPAFKDERVRMALNMAIDRAGYFKNVLAGIGYPSTERFLKGQYGNCGETTIKYNPERARALLKEAGASNLSFEVPAWGPFNLWNEALASYLRQVGVTMKISPIAPGSQFAEAASGKWAAFLLPMPERHPAILFQNRVALNGAYNPFKIDERDLISLGNKALRADAKVAEPLWAKINCEIAQRGIIIQLGGFVTPIMYNPNKVAALEGMTLSPGTPSYRTIKMK
jgi:peptide/nickel transport system substrate-binding protein